jgi:PAS domain S-box-containing protein
MKKFAGSRNEESFEGTKRGLASVYEIALGALIISIAYYLGALVGVALLYPNALYSAIWPPNAIMLAVLLMTPARRWWVYLLAIIPAHFIAVGSIGTPLWRMLWQICFNTVLAVLTAICLQYFSKRNLRFDRNRPVIIYLITITGTLSLCSLLPPAVVLALIEGRDFWPVWLACFFSNFIGFISLTPIILLCFADGISWLRGISLKNWLEKIIASLGLIAICIYVYEVGGLGLGNSGMLLYLPLPFLLWASVRFGPRGTYAAIMIFSLITSWSGVNGHGPFVIQSAIGGVIFLQLFLVSVSIPLMLLAAIIQEQQRDRQELKKSSAEIDRQFAQLTTIYQTTPIGLAFLDTNLCFVRINDHLAEIHGLPAMDHIGRTFREVLPEIADLAEPVYRKVIETGKPVIGVVGHGTTPARPGVLRDWLIDKYPVKDEHGAVIGVHTVVQDITERKKAEQALRESEAKFRGVFESDIVPFIFWQADGQITDANDAFLKLTGFTRVEMEEGLLRWWEMIPRKNTESADQSTDHVRSGGFRTALEHEYELRDGRRVPVLVGSAYLEGYSDRGVGFAIDLSERKRAEEALRESEERLRLALEAGQMGVWDWNPQTNHARWSKEHFTNFGLEPFSVEQSYSTWAKQVHPDDLPRAVEAMKEAIEERIEYKDEYRIIRPDGTIRWVGVRGKPFYSDTGECIRMMGLSTDITERKLAERALLRSEEELRESHARIEYLAGRLIVAQEEERKHIARELHDDLIQRVAAVAIGLGRLERQLPHSDDSLRKQIIKLDERMSQLSEQIRRLSHELHSSTLEHVGLTAALKLYCTEFTALQGVSIDLKIQEDIEPVPAETALCLYRVVQESLRNVAKHSGSKNAEVELGIDDDDIELRISDDGVGFDLEDAKERQGLGLVSMEERVKLVHGKFEVKSGKGAGTELLVSIPLNSTSFLSMAEG